MCLSGRFIWVGVVVSLLSLPAVPGRADNIYLKDGTTKEGTIVEETDEKIILEMTIRGIKASLHIPMEEIERIERTRSKKEALADQEKSIQADDAQGWLKLGMKYKALDLGEDARRCFEKALRADPQNEAASRELSGIKVAGRSADVDMTIRKGADLVEAKEYAKAVEILEPLLSQSTTAVNSLQRKDVLTSLIRCYECKGEWAKAQDAWDKLLKCPTVNKGEVAVVRVKQRILRENPDGMIDLTAVDANRKKAQAGLKLEDIPGQLVKAPIEIASVPVKVGAELLKGKPQPKSAKDHKPKEEKKPDTSTGKQPLSDPKIMELVLRAEAETILVDAQKTMEKADAQAQSDKIWEFTLFPQIANWASGSRPKQPVIRSSPADKLYEQAADAASDGDLLIAGISAPLRLKIAQKRAALLDEFIEKTRKEVEGHSYYMPSPPPNTPPAQVQAMLQQQNIRIQTLNITMDQANKYLDLLQRLDALQARKIEFLEPFSDMILPQVEKVQKDREQIVEIRRKGEKINELAEAIKENERLEALLQEFNVKARANQPRNFEDQMGFEKYVSADGLYRFKDNGRKWRAQTDVCIGYCEKAMETGRKRIALLRKFPDRPSFARDVDTTKSVMVQIYQLQQGVLMERERKGRPSRYY